VALHLELQHSADMPSQLAFRHTILNAPALKVLKIRYIATCGQLLFADGEVLPQLETLSLDTYGVGQGEPRQQIQKHMQLHKLKQLTLTGWDQYGFNRFFESLTVPDISTALPMVSLISLSMMGSYNMAPAYGWTFTLVEFLCSFDGLEILLLNDVRVRLSGIHDAISHHCKSLQVLIIQEPSCSFCSLKNLSLVPFTALGELSLGTISRRNRSFIGMNNWIACSQDLHSLKKLSITTHLHGENVLFAKPLVDEAFVRNVAFELGLPSLKRLVVRSWCDCVAEDFKRIPKEWEDFQKMEWEVENNRIPESLEDVAECCTFRERNREERMRPLRIIIDALGDPCNPPDTFTEFKVWKEDLEKRYKQHMKIKSNTRSVRILHGGPTLKDNLLEMRNIDEPVAACARPTGNALNCLLCLEETLAIYDVNIASIKDFG